MARETLPFGASALLLPYGGSAGVYATLAKIVLDETLAAHTARESSQDDSRCTPCSTVYTSNTRREHATSMPGHRKAVTSHAKRAGATVSVGLRLRLRRRRPSHRCSARRLGGAAPRQGGGVGRHGEFLARAARAVRVAPSWAQAPCTARSDVARHAGAPSWARMAPSWAPSLVAPRSSTVAVAPSWARVAPSWAPRSSTVAVAPSRARPAAQRPRRPERSARGSAASHPRDSPRDPYRDSPRH